jgi:hypothetical protein
MTNRIKPLVLQGVLVLMDAFCVHPASTASTISGASDVKRSIGAA